MTLGQYITAVSLEIDKLSDGTIDLDNMIDYADGALSLTELHESGLTPRQAAKVLLAQHEDTEMFDCGGDFEVMDYLMGVD